MPGWHAGTVWHCQLTCNAMHANMMYIIV
jgi:hypothetical protein